MAMTQRRFTARDVIVVTSLLLASTLCSVTAEDPQFDPANRPRRAVVRSGATVAFQCSVLNLGDKQISWWFLNHNLQLSRGTEVLVDTRNSDGTNKYKVEQLLGSDGVWSLEISNVTAEDRGHYQCRVEGVEPVLAQVNWLHVSDAPQPTRPVNLPRVNFTDCCKDEGVSAACMPACYPAGIMGNFDYNDCEADLLSLLKCGSDGRNHAPCCFRRGLPSKCLDFCTNQPPSVIDGTYNECLDRVDDIIFCYEEGQHLLPSAPTGFTVATTQATSLSLTWSPPEENGNSVTGYRVSYGVYTRTDINYTSTDIITTESTTLRSLTPNVRYSLYVVALNAHGSSQRSYVITAVTSQNGPTIPGSNETLLDCCARRGVSEVCRPVLCGARIASPNDSRTIDCLQHYDKVSACLSGEKNHTACCAERGIRPGCYPICAGQGFSDYSQLDCITDLLPEISSCFIENTDKLPGPPSNARVTMVTPNSMVVQWDPPTSHPEQTDGYVIQYSKVASSHSTHVIVGPTVQSYTLDNLDRSSYYTIKIEAKNTRGTSLPTPSITALTHYSRGRAARWVAPTQQPTGQSGTDPLQCCREKGVNSQCHGMCDYAGDFESLSQTEALTCIGDIPQILACGSNGRNHSDCCQAASVPASCLLFCALTHETAASLQLGIQHVACVYHITDVVTCLREGQVYLPEAPGNVQVVDRSSNTLTLGWTVPPEPRPSTQDFIVRIRTVGRDGWNATVTDSETSHIFQNLQVDTAYELQVLTQTGNGSSLPSETIRARTEPAGSTMPPLLPDGDVTIPPNVTACCIEKGVASGCVSGCGSGSVNPRSCNSSLSSILQCATDGRDHTACCRRSDVPRACLPLCAGRQPPGGAFCLAFTQLLLSCFHQGRASLPGRPTRMRLESVNQTSLTLSWDAPVPTNPSADHVGYVLLYRARGQMQYTYIQNVSSPYTLRHLVSDTFYELAVYSVNDGGASQPSDTVTVRTLRQSKIEVQIFQSPSGYVRAGQNVTLTCVAVGDPYPTVSWLLRNGTEQQGSTLTIRYLTEELSGGYTCVATNQQATHRVTWYLRMQGLVRVIPFSSVVYAAPGRGDSAVLGCQFTGYPDRDSYAWMKGDVQLDTGPRSRYRVRMKDDASQGIVDSALEIQAVRTEDFGSYMCRGSNSAGGPSAARIQLMDSAQQTVTLPPFQPRPAVPNITACCIERDVNPTCRGACTWEVDISVFERLDTPLECLADINHLIECAADGKNHTGCCFNAGVPSACLDFCGGVVPPLDATHLVCLQNVNKIVQCMQQGHGKIPSAPYNVGLQLDKDGYIHVWWDPPKQNLFTVERYTVYFNSKYGDKYQHVDKDMLSYTIRGVHSNTRYTVVVKAGNHYGNSNSSNNVSKTTHELRPSAPQNLKWLVSSTFVRLDWDLPEVHSGGVLYYNVYTRRKGDKQFKKVKTADHTQFYLLHNLDPNTQYEMYVTANSTNYESEASNTVLILPPNGKSAKQTGSSNSVGVGVGLGVLFVALIVIAAVAIFVFWYFRIRKSPKQRYDSSVAFENPGYANAAEGRVHGIPTGGFKDGGGGGGGLASRDMEAEQLPIKDGAILQESEADNGYATLSSDGAVNPVYATLDPVHSEHVDLTTTR